MNKLYFVTLVGDYGGGGAVICAENKQKALKIAKSEFDGSDWYQVEEKDIEELSTSKTGLISLSFHME